MGLDQSSFLSMLDKREAEPDPKPATIKETPKMVEKTLPAVAPKGVDEAVIRLVQVNQSRWEVHLEENFPDGKGYTKKVFTGKKDLCMAYAEGYSTAAGIAIRLG